MPTAFGAVDRNLNVPGAETATRIPRDVTTEVYVTTCHGHDYHIESRNCWSLEVELDCYAELAQYHEPTDRSLTGCSLRTPVRLLSPSSLGLTGAETATMHVAHMGILSLSGGYKEEEEEAVNENINLGYSQDQRYS